MVVAGQSGHELGAVYGKWTRAHVNRLRGKARPTGGNFMGIGIGYWQFILGGGGDSSREQQWRTTTIDGDKRRRVSWTVGQWEFRGMVTHRDFIEWSLFRLVEEWGFGTRQYQEQL